MRIDIVTADEGYFGIYVDGELEWWGRANPFHMLATIIGQRCEIASFNVRHFGSYGDQAVGWDPMPQRFEDIPEIWWTNEPYTEPSFDDWEAAK